MSRGTHTPEELKFALVQKESGRLRLQRFYKTVELVQAKEAGERECAGELGKGVMAVKLKTLLLSVTA